MPLDYDARFKGIVDSDSDSQEEAVGANEDSFVSRAQSEEGMMRAFVTIHDRRLELDKMAEVSPPKSDVMAGYDDVCDRLLVLDGVKDSAKIKSVGHRIEFATAALGAAKAYLAQGGLEVAASRATAALEAAALRQGEDSAGAWEEKHLRRGAWWLHELLREAYMCRAEVRMRLGSYRVARADALEAYPIACKLEDTEKAEAAQQLALRCEFGLHGGGPPDGSNREALSPKEVEEMELSSIGGGAASGAFAPGREGGSADSEDEAAEGSGRPDSKASQQHINKETFEPGMQPAIILDLSAMD